VIPDRPTEIVAVEDEEEDTHRDDEYATNSIEESSSHRDGSIYTGLGYFYWKKYLHVADRGETRLEPMMFTDPTPDCGRYIGDCWRHRPTGMLQIFSIQVAKLPANAGSVELYGYVATRDNLDPLLNYIVNISRDDPVIVEQGSLVPMTGPKRGIEVGIDCMEITLVEYDMRIKVGQHEKDDLQILDGASMLGNQGSWGWPFKLDTPGDFGTIDITLSRVRSAVEATVEVVILQVQTSFNLALVCLSSGFKDEQIMLFDGAIAESRGLKRSVVAVASHSYMDLKFNVAGQPSTPDQHCCSFKAEIHGHVTQHIKTEFALISVKVTWSTLQHTTMA
jgi:hypothetical protein